MKTFLNWFLMPLVFTMFFFVLIWYYNTIVEALLYSILFVFPISMAGQVYVNDVFGEQFVYKPKRKAKEMIAKLFTETRPTRKEIVYELPAIADVNTIYMLNDREYIYVVGDGWLMIADNTPKSVKEEKPKYQPRLVCTSCGSTNVIYTNGVHKCTYCGTQYIMEE